MMPVDRRELAAIFALAYAIVSVGAGFAAVAVATNLVRRAEVVR